MKTTEFKVHTIYSKDDIVQMEKVTTKKLRIIVTAASLAVLALYFAVVAWLVSGKENSVSVISFMFGNILNVVFLAVLVALLIVMAFLPRIQAKRILKEAPGGVLKAKYYFYEKTFQYGWGNTFTSTAYVDIQEFRNLPGAFYIRAKDVTYWVKKEDFQMGTPEKFLEYMKGKLKCKVIEK